MGRVRRLIRGGLLLALVLVAGAGRVSASPPLSATGTVEGSLKTGHALTPPVKSAVGFSWGTLGLAIAVALFAGAFVGNLFTSRRRPAPRPSLYGAVQRRMAEEKEKAGT